MAEIKDICSKAENLLKELGCEFEVCWGYNKDIHGSADNNFKNYRYKSAYQAQYDY